MAKYDGSLLKSLGDALLPFLVELFKKTIDGLGTTPGAPPGTAAATKHHDDATIKAAVQKALEC